MISPTIKIQGRDKVIANLSAFSVRVSMKVEDTIIKFGEQIALDAREKSGFKDKTGLYRKSIRAKYLKKSYTSVISSFYKGRVSRIAHLLEFGTFKSKAYPHLGPALDMNVDLFENAVESVVRQAIGGV